MNYLCGSGTLICGSGSTIYKFLAPAPAIQNCCLPGSFLLVRVAGQFIARFKLFSKWELSIGLDFKSNVLYQRYTTCVR